MESQQERPEPEPIPQEGPRRTFTSLSYVRRKLFANDTQVPTHEPTISPSTSNASRHTSASVFSTQTSKTSNTAVSAEDGSKPQPRSSLQAVHKNNVPTIQVTTTLCMLPTMPVPERHFNTWHDGLQERLNDEFSAALNTAWGHFEFKMVRDKSGRVGPCIIFIDWDDTSCTTPQGCDKARKKLKKLLRSLQALNGCPFPVEVVMDRTSLLGPAVTERLMQAPNRSAMLGAPIEARIKQRPSSLVGVQIRRADDVEQICTLGGMAFSFGQRLALSVSHPFSSSPLEAESTCTEPDLFDDVDDEEDDLSAYEEDDPASLFDGYESVLLDCVPSHVQQIEDQLDNSAKQAAVPRLAQRRSSVAANDAQQADFQALGQIVHHSGEYMVENGTLYNYDWVLIELDLDIETLPNAFIDPEKRVVDILWDGDFHFNLGDQASVLAGFSGFQEARIGQRQLQLTIRGIRYEVTQVLLSRPLAFGDSGSWVICNSCAVGCIIAGLESIPYAYMVPMASVLEDIRCSVTNFSDSKDSSYSFSESLQTGRLENLSPGRKSHKPWHPKIHQAGKHSIEADHIGSAPNESTAFDKIDFSPPPAAALLGKDEADLGALEMTTYAKGKSGANGTLDNEEPTPTYDPLMNWLGNGNAYDEEANQQGAWCERTSPRVSDPPPKLAPVLPSEIRASLPVSKGWGHRGTSSPLRTAKPTRLGTIDENGGMSPDVPARSRQRPMRHVLDFVFPPTLHSSRSPPPYVEYNDVTGPNGERFTDLRRKHVRLRRGGLWRLSICVAIALIIIVAMIVGLVLGLKHR